MTGGRGWPKLIAWCALLLPLTASAQVLKLLGGEEDTDKKDFVELEVKLPPRPKEGNLIPFEANAASSNSFFIDGPSITVADDGTVRYTLVVKSPSGAENISYEAIRCETREQKIYAFGRRDGTWSNARTSEWREITGKGSPTTQNILHRYYFCPLGSAVRTAKDAINRLKYPLSISTPPGSNDR